MKRNWFFFPRVLLVLLFASPLSFGQLWSGILSPSRAVDWSQAGVVGGIPSGSWTQCGSTIAAGASVSTINSAINSCSANHYVQLGAGTFNLTGGVILKSHVAVRGMGADKTFLIFTGHDGCGGLGATLCMASGDVNYWGKPSNTANWTAGYTPGTTSITLSSKSNLAVGTPITLDQADDTSDAGDIFVCYTPKGVCSTNGDNGGFLRSGRSQEQLVLVTSISGSGPYTVGISPGIYMPNWSSSKSPQAWWPTSPIVNAGYENLSVDSTSSGANESVGIFNCNGCWVSGIRSIGPGRSHVMAWQSPHTTVQNSYFYRTANQSSSSYGLEFNNSSDSLAQNNIYQQLSAPYVNNGSCSGCVMAYSFDINNLYNSGGGVYNYQQQSWYPHTAGDDHILAEGNQGAGMYSDNFHGTHQFQTLFRNAYNGRQPNNGNTTTGGLGALLINAFSRFYNVVGNVLGTSTFGRYRSDMGGSGSAIVSVGIGDGVPNDANVGRTLLMWGNYDTVTKAVRWCGNSSSPGWSSTCGSTSEIPTNISSYSNPVPSSTQLPPSFYLNTKPSWWPSGKPWPAIGPDVTGGNLAGYAGYAYTIPAADCYTNVMRGPGDGTGSVLSFSADACYGSSGGGGGTSNPPPPPTGLAASVS
jgi:hypothetical protein